MYYNGLPHTELIAGESKRNGIDAWCRAGGIAGRGVLLDWLAWWENTHPSGEPAPSPVTRHEIPIAELQEVARYQGLDGKFRPGDILLVRSGFVRWHDNASQDERKKGTLEKATYIGMEATPDGLEWFWSAWLTAGRHAFLHALIRETLDVYLRAGTTTLPPLEETPSRLKPGRQPRERLAVSLVPLSLDFRWPS